LLTPDDLTTLSEMTTPSSSQAWATSRVEKSSGQYLGLTVMSS
jgi:hypothetical protein